MPARLSSLVLVLVASLACGCGSSADGRSLLGGSGGSSAGGSGSGRGGLPSAGGATPGTGGAPSLSGGATGSGGTTLSGSGGALAAPAPPTPAAPCGDDLDVTTGTVIPDLGELPPPAAFTGSDTAEPGPFAHTSQAVSVPIAAETFQGVGLTIQVAAGQLPGTAWLPSGSARHPLVMVLAGFQASYTFYAPYAEHLASHGFAVLGVDTRSDLFVASHDKEAVEVMRAVDWALGASPFASRLDGTKVAVAGHSKGGKVAFFTAALDPRVDVAIGWDPVNAGGGPCAFDPNCNALPVAPNCTASRSGVQHLSHAESLVIGAPPDPAFNPDPNHNAIHFYRGAPSPASLVLLDTGHVPWATGASDAAVFRITKRVHTAVLLRRFFGVTGLEAFLPDGARVTSEPLLLDARVK